VQARLLARQTPAEVARLTGLSAEAVDAYEGLFYHCRPHLDARDWVTFRLIGRTLESLKAPDAGVVLKGFAYHGGPHVLEAVVPYLVGRKKLFDDKPDLSTAEGRREQVVRLAVAAEMLAPGDANGLKLARIVLLQRERELGRQIRPGPLGIVAKRLESGLAELPPGDPNEHQEEVKSPSLAAVAEALREVG
jgi:hypothetical protein